MDGHARLAAAPLHIEAQLEPGKLANTRRRPSLGVGDVHVFAVPDHEGVAEALGDIGGTVGAEAEALLGGEDEPVGP